MATPRNIPAYKDEGHSLEIGLIPLQLGDIRRWDEQEWQVAHVETYTSTRETNNRFRVAVLSPDGTVSKSPLYSVGHQRLMYLCISREDFALAWPEPDECLPEVGAEAPPLDGWEVERIQAFVGDGAEYIYDFPPETLALKERLRQRERVLVCWCAPIRIESEQTAA